MAGRGSLNKEQIFQEELFTFVEEDHAPSKEKCVNSSLPVNENEPEGAVKDADSGSFVELSERAVTSEDDFFCDFRFQTDEEEKLCLSASLKFDETHPDEAVSLSNESEECDFWTFRDDVLPLEESEETDISFTFADEFQEEETETFFQALRNRDLPRIKEFLRNGENVSRCDAFGWTPLQIAAGSGSFEIVKCLLEHGAKMDSAKLPVFFAADSGALDVVCFLLETFNISPSCLDPDGNSLLHHAAESHSPELVQFLIESGIPIDLQGSARLTALERASREGDLRTVQLLVEAGAEVNSEGGRWSAPLHEARNPFHHGIFLYGPPIYAAAAGGHFDVVQYLVEHGADVNAKDCQGRTVLHAASRAENPNVMQFLQKLGAQ